MSYNLSKSARALGSHKSRRAFLAMTGSAAALCLSTGVQAATKMLNGEKVTDGIYEIQRTEAEWRDLLTENQFLILRKEKTERKFTSPLLDEKRAGLYHCAGCDLPAYSSEAKYDSKTGWPSFWESLDNAVRVKEDRSLFSTRTEVHCRRCGGHFGHIFDDGPEPTGQRHCLNGLALTFQPAA